MVNHFAQAPGAEWHNMPTYKAFKQGLGFNPRVTQKEKKVNNSIPVHENFINSKQEAKHIQLMN